MGQVVEVVRLAAQSLDVAGARGHMTKLSGHNLALPEVDRSGR